MRTYIVDLIGFQKLRFVTSLLVISLIFSTHSVAIENDNPAMTRSANNLIVYLSRTKNTETVAKMIHDVIGGDRVALELITPYPSDYQTMVNQVREENQNNILPQLKTNIANIGQYDNIFIGYPTWGMQLPPPIKSFLHQYDLQGKTIIPFNTNAGYGLGNSIETLTELCRGCTILPSFSVTGGNERDGQLLMIKDQRLIEVKGELQQWLKQLGFHVEK